MAESRLWLRVVRGFQLRKMTRLSMVVSSNIVKLEELEEQLSMFQEYSRKTVEKFSGELQELQNEFKQSAKENENVILGELRSLLVHLVGDEGKETHVEGKTSSRSGKKGERPEEFYPTETRRISNLELILKACLNYCLKLN